MNNHEMMYVCDKDGFEVWVCLECGRQYRIKWQPWKRIVDEPGDDVPHSGGKGGIQIGGMSLER